MLKRFLDGLVFGAGFALAMLAIWWVATLFVFPRMIEFSLMEPKDPRFGTGRQSMVGKSAFAQAARSMAGGEAPGFEGRGEIQEICRRAEPSMLSVTRRGAAKDGRRSLLHN